MKFAALLFLIATSAIAAPPPQSVTQLRWLAGCWSADGEQLGSVEQWLAPAGGTLLGMSRTVRDGKTVESEFMQIEERDGTLVFIATPSGQSRAEFRAIELTASRVVFENRAHDFPQRVIYERVAPTKLRARIEGAKNGKSKGIDFPMTRASCE
ncbi:MAG TPA: DUF6265 family protein [Thermoanaerobaculia bacterium]|nr:DUF6265 family protein [Thermoanaerobaculia bacterium]